LGKPARKTINEKRPRTSEKRVKTKKRFFRGGRRLVRKKGENCHMRSARGAENKNQSDLKHLKRVAPNKSGVTQRGGKRKPPPNGALVISDKTDSGLVETDNQRRKRKAIVHFSYRTKLRGFCKPWDQGAFLAQIKRIE